MSKENTWQQLYNYRGYDEGKYALVGSFILYLKDLGIKLIALDFDGTLTKYHTHYDRQVREIFQGSEKDLQLKPEISREQAREIFSDPEILELILMMARENFIEVACVSKRSYDALHSLLKKALGEGFCRLFTKGIHGVRNSLDHTKFYEIGPWEQQKYNGGDKLAFFHQVITGEHQIKSNPHSDYRYDGSQIVFFDDSELARENHATHHFRAALEGSGILTFGGQADYLIPLGIDYSRDVENGGLNLKNIMGITAKLYEKLMARIPAASAHNASALTTSFEKMRF